ncbi:MAG: hypothetical protein NC226_12080 [Bacteroides cellulosilyticus]|nr:hypothetical protein [Bacteroides cellulosilyticus]
MEFTLIYKHPKTEPARCAERILLAAIYDEEELRSFGLSDKSDDLNECYLGKDEFTKWRKLWQDPYYLSDFYCNHIEFFRDPYWKGIDEEEFVTDTIAAAPRIFQDLKEALTKNELEELFQPLAPEDARRAEYASIRVKSKFGRILQHYAFRIYAIKVDEGCYVITGGAIKIEKDMGKAPNTQIELAKLNYTYGALCGEGLTDKASFLNFIFE